MRLSTAFASIALLYAPAWAAAEVVDSSPGGFTVRTILAVQASPEDVFRRLVRSIGEWWDPAHTFSGDAHNLSIEEKPMGCFCEELAGQGSVRHMEIVFLAPGKRLLMTGGLGPLQPLAVTGTMTVQFSPAAGGTRLEVTYAVGGYLPAGLNTLAAPVDSVLNQQFTRLKNYVERGNPVPKSGPPGAR